MGFFSIDLKNQMLNAIAGISPVLWIQKVSLHYDDPGTSGENEISGGEL